MTTLGKMNAAIKAVICAVIVALAMPALALADHNDGRGGRRDRDNDRYERSYRGRDHENDRDRDDRRGGRRVKAKKFKHLWWERDFSDRGLHRGFGRGRGNSRFGFGYFR